MFPGRIPSGVQEFFFVFVNRGSLLGTCPGVIAHRVRFKRAVVSAPQLFPKKAKDQQVAGLLPLSYGLRFPGSVLILCLAG